MHQQLGATYSVLGPRESSYLFQDKDEIFEKALLAVENKLSNPAGETLESAADLVSLVFSDDSGAHDADTLAIREALKSRSLINHCLSATGNKVLAYLAVVSDAGCIDDRDQIRLEYTKSVIRHFFSNPDDIELDDSAIRNIRFEDNTTPRTGETDGPEFRTLVFGKNRFRNVSVQINYEKYDNKVVIDNARRKADAATLTTAQLSIDLTEVPQKAGGIELARYREAALGDMHGNSLLLLNKLVQLGFIEVTDESEWPELTNAIRTNNYDALPDLLTRVIGLAPGGDKTKLVALGDLFADRMYSDFAMLQIFDHLNTLGLHYEIIFSNHDADFVRYILNNRYRSVSEPNVLKRSGMLNLDASKSIDRLDEHLNRNPAARRQFFDMVNRSYLNHLKVMSLSSRYLTFHCHGILNDAIFNRLAELAGADADDHCLRERVHRINKWFVESVLSSNESYERHLPVAQPDLQDTSPEFSWKNFPLYLAVWNMGPIPGKIMDDRNKHPEELKYVESTDLPATGVRRVVHGHTQSFTSYKDKHTALLDQLNELAPGLLRASVDSGQLSWLEQINRYRQTADELFPQLDELVSANGENGIDRKIIELLDLARRHALLISFLPQALLEIEDEISFDRHKGKERIRDADADRLKERLMDSIKSGDSYQRLGDEVRTEVDAALASYFRGPFADQYANEDSFFLLAYRTSTELFAILNSGIEMSINRCRGNLTYIEQRFSDHSRNYYSLDDKFGQIPEHVRGAREVYLE